MKSFKAKLTILLITMLLITMLVPFGSVAAAEGDLQVQLIGTDDDDDGTIDNIVVYLEDLEKAAFDYALSTNANATEMDLNYINSVQDEDGNQVALISVGDLSQTENNYLYIRENDGTEKNVQLNVDVNNMFTQDKMTLVENTTKRIATEENENLSSREEVRDGITYTYTVGGLKITDDQNATYSYVMVNVSSNEDYNELQNLANGLNDSSKSMYEKIKIANDFYNKYNELISNADVENSWQEVKDMQILQNEDYENEEHYVILLKKVAENGTTYDAKFMTTDNRGTEEIIPASTKQVTTEETSKLPITGDSIVLFVVLAALVIIAIVVFIRMKKLNKKADK